MPSSALLLAKRALVSLLRALAVAYGLDVQITRDSLDVDVARACRRVALRAHPDRGGNTADQQRLNDARAAHAHVQDSRAEQCRPGRFCVACRNGWVRCLADSVGVP